MLLTHFSLMQNYPPHNLQKMIVPQILSGWERRLIDQHTRMLMLFSRARVLH